jgi:hypothetical protein
LLILSVWRFDRFRTYHCIIQNDCSSSKNRNFSRLGRLSRPLEACHHFLSNRAAVICAVRQSAHYLIARYQITSDNNVTTSYHIDPNRRGRLRHTKTRAAVLALHHRAGLELAVQRRAAVGTRKVLQ